MIIEDKNNVSTDDYAIRRLTPRECWRLMDFSDSDFDKAKANFETAIKERYPDITQVEWPE